MSDATPVGTAFGQRLAQLRTDKQLSQEALAHRADLHRTLISKLEKGTNVPRLDTVLKLAASLEIEPGQMIAELPVWTPQSTSPGVFK